MENSIPLNNPQEGTLSFLRGWLDTVVKIGVGTVLVGQWAFALYILVRFTLPLITGQIDESQFTSMIRGYVNGETYNNTVLLVHIIPVMIISLSATFQLVPYVRKRFPGFHRLNGRIFLTVGLMGAFTGIYMTWFIGSRLSDVGSLGVTLNGLLIPVFIFFAWRYAIQKRFVQHRRFAIHAFILINGVWTFRLYLMAWFMVNQGPLGNSRSIDGPADIAISFASFLLPMAIAELVFWAERQRKAVITLLAACGASLLLLVTLTGVVAAITMMWAPRIMAAL